MDIKDFIPQSIKNYLHLLQSYIANIKYGFPAADLKIIGVTGTDGKTTTATMIYEILKRSGFKVGLITTVSAKVGKKEIETGLHVTTPGPADIPRFLKMMVDAGMEWVVLEVTSHGLDQNRIANIAFEKAVFTNITHEHLDYHKSWRRLALAKAKLIKLVKEGGQVIYKEDERGGKFIANQIRKASNITIPVACNDEEVKAKDVSKEGLRFKYNIRGNEEEIFIPILGEYNISNAQCAIKVCEDLVKKEDIIDALACFKTVKGRMEIVRRSRPCTIIVDFAHTPNGLKGALETVNTLKGEGRAFVVFGTAGRRDKSKRPMMGKIAAKLADIIVITAEDPRDEKLKSINTQIFRGAKIQKGKLIIRFKNRKSFLRTKLELIIKDIEKALKGGRKPVIIFDEESVKSREDAIEFAIKIAQKDDVVIATGKAHEKSLCFGNIEYPWSDFEAVRRAIKLRYSK